MVPISTRQSPQRKCAPCRRRNWCPNDGAGNGIGFKPHTGKRFCAPSRAVETTPARPAQTPEMITPPGCGISRQSRNRTPSFCSTQCVDVAAEPHTRCQKPKDSATISEKITGTGIPITLAAKSSRSQMRSRIPSWHRRSPAYPTENSVGAKGDNERV